MKRPSFQFYPGDWTGNSNLRRCTHAEKGAWLDIMCLMHDQGEYGVLRWPMKEIAQAAGCAVALVKGLVSKGVLKGDDKALVEPFVYTPRSGRKDGEPVTLVTPQDGPIWYSSRMVKDEYVRTIRGEGSRFGEGNDAAPKAAPKQPSKPSPKPPLGDGSSSSSSSSPSGKDNPPPPPVTGGSAGTLTEKKARVKSERMTLKTFLDRCRETGDRPIGGYEPLQRYIAEAKLPVEFVNLAWAEFKRDFGPGGKRERKQQAMWRRHFQNFVEGNFYRLWYAKPQGDGIAYELTTVGLQAQMATQTREAA